MRFGLASLLGALSLGLLLCAACSDDTSGSGGGTVISTSSTTSATSGSGGSGGGGDPCDAADPLSCTECVDDVSLFHDLQPMLTTDCATAACHAGSMPKGQLNLSVSKSRKGLLDVPSIDCTDRALVTAGDPSQSYVMNKLLEQDLCAGTLMPPAGKLPAKKIRLIKSWICNGAPDN